MTDAQECGDGVTAQIALLEQTGEPAAVVVWLPAARRWVADSFLNGLTGPTARRCWPAIPTTIGRARRRR